MADDALMVDQATFGYERFDVTLKEIYSPSECENQVQPRGGYSATGRRELSETATSIAEEIGISQPGVGISVDGGDKTGNKMGFKL